jgi:ATP-dependent Clp protease protease subunit
MKSNTFDSDPISGDWRDRYSESVWVTDFNTLQAIEFCETIQRRFEENPLKPIIIRINSDGGNVDDLFMMLDAMDAITAAADPQFFSFITYATGKAYSAAAALLSYGSVRIASPRSRIMLHQVLGGAFGAHPDVEVQHKEMTAVNNQILDLIRKNCMYKGTVDDLKNYLQRDKFFSPQEAKEFGIIDHIGHPKLVDVRLSELIITNTPSTEEKTSIASKKGGKR